MKSIAVSFETGYKTDTEETVPLSNDKSYVLGHKTKLLGRLPGTGSDCRIRRGMKGN